MKFVNIGVKLFLLPTVFNQDGRYRFE